MTKKPDKSHLIDHRTLIRIYKTIKNEPNKVFVMTELLSGGTIPMKKRYMATLKCLGLIEGVKAFYKAGPTSRSRVNCKGYKLSTIKLQEVKK